MKKLIKKIPLVGPIAVSIKKKIRPSSGFTTSQEYWINRYKSGGNSGSGSYNNLAEFKGEVINEFVSENNIQTVIELGSGDGNQLRYFKFPAYIGFDVSDTVLEMCRKKFKNDPSKQFMNVNDISDQRAEMVMSLDVIYHLIEDETYHQYMTRLFKLSERYVIIYANDEESTGDFAPHVKPRKFSTWIAKNEPGFKLIKHIPNKYPFVKDKQESTSHADFYIYAKS